MTANVDAAISNAERLARMEEKIDTLLERSREDRTDFKSRLRNLELWRYGTGAAIVASLANLVPPSVKKG